MLSREKRRTSSEVLLGPQSGESVSGSRHVDNARFGDSSRLAGNVPRHPEPQRSNPLPSPNLLSLPCSVAVEIFLSSAAVSSSLIEVESGQERRKDIGSVGDRRSDERTGAQPPAQTLLPECGVTMQGSNMVSGEGKKLIREKDRRSCDE